MGKHKTFKLSMSTLHVPTVDLSVLTMSDVSDNHHVFGRLSVIHKVFRILLPHQVVRMRLTLTLRLNSCRYTYIMEI